MAAQDTAPKKLTLRNTKEEMLDAYQAVLRQLDEKRKVEQKPEEKIQEKKTAEVVAAADALSTEGIGREIGNLKSEIGKMLIQLSDRLEGEMARYENVKQAVESKERELKEIYEIQKNATSLMALIETQRQKREAFDEAMAADKAALEEEIETRRDEWEREATQRELDIKETAAANKKKLDREAEEYRYAAEREKKLARETFEDEKARLERELTLRRETLDRELAERERAVAACEEEIESLRRRAETFPAELDQAVARAAKEAGAREIAQADSKLALMKKEFEGERGVFLSRIEALEKSLKEQSAQNAKLAQQIEKSYGQVQEIAVKAIEGSSSSQTLAGLQQWLADQSRRPAKGE